VQERGRFEHELLALEEPEHETPEPEWPPKALKGTVLFRHWRLNPADAKKPFVVVAADLDPGFVAGPAAKDSCLKKWTESTAATAKGALVAYVDLKTTGPRYTSLNAARGTEVTSTSKIGVMYPAFQLRNDLQVLANRETPANTAALREAALKQWTTDILDAGWFPRNATGTALARKWVLNHAPKLVSIVSMDSATKKVSFETDFNDAVTSMIVDSSDAGRRTCIQLLGDKYITSVLSQSGKIAGLKPLAWAATLESLATLLTLIARRRLVGLQESEDMFDLLKRAATSGSQTWTRYALDGADDDADASLRRARSSVAGKIGFLYRGKKATWWDNVFTMADASLVQKTISRAYVLVFAIPRVPGVIRQKDIFPLIRALHDCI
jgi:hypothetical protein